MPGATKFSALCFGCSKLKDDCTELTVGHWLCTSCHKHWRVDDVSEIRPVAVPSESASSSVEADSYAYIEQRILDLYDREGKESKSKPSYRYESPTGRLPTSPPYDLSMSRNPCGEIELGEWVKVRLVPPLDPPMENACGERAINQSSCSWQIAEDGALTAHHITEMMARLIATSKDICHWAEQCQRLLYRVEGFKRRGGLKLSDFLHSEEEMERQQQIEDLSLAMRLEKDPQRRHAFKHKLYALVYGARPFVCLLRSQS